MSVVSARSSGRSASHGGGGSTGFDRSRIDVRLLPVAVVLWASEASVIVSVDRGWTTYVLVVWGVVMLGLWGAVARRSPFESGSGGTGRGRAGGSGAQSEFMEWVGFGPRLVVVVGVCVLVGCGLALLRIAPLVDEPVRTLAQQHASVRLTAAIAEPPRLSRRQPLAPAWSAGTHPQARNWSARSTVTEIREGEKSWQVGVPMLLVGADSSDYLRLLTPGVTVTVDASLSPTEVVRGNAAVARIRGSPQVNSAAPTWQRAATHVRRAMRDASAGLGPDERGLLPGLVVGDESALSDELRDEMQSVGLSHLTAVSGANLAIVTGLVVGIAAIFRVRRRVTVVLAALALLSFVAVVGPQASVLRAAMMGAIGLLAAFTARERVGITALVSSVMILLLVDPWMSVSMGFALSVAATGGLLAYSLIQARSRRAREPSGSAADESALSGRATLTGPGIAAKARHGLHMAFGVAIAAQLATLPIIASFGGGLPLVGVLANVLAEPAVPFATVIGCMAAAVASVAPSGGPVLAAVAGYATWWIAQVAHWSAGLPVAVIPWPGGLLGFASALALVAVMLLGWVYRQKVIRFLRANKRRSAVISVVVLVAGLCVRGQQPQWPPAGWVMVACDVGQGDALVLRTSDGHAALVDAGPDKKKVSRCLRDLGIAVIDLVVLSHFHADHVDGLVGALDGRPVGSAVVSPLAEPVDQYKSAMGALKDRGVDPRVAAPGEQGEVGPLKYQILWPTRLVRSSGSAPNNASVVMSVELGNPRTESGTPTTRILLTGDVEPAAQDVLLSQLAPAGFDIVKVPHHGSRNQSGRLTQWFPAALGLISVGKGNRYGHPAQSTIHSWEAVGTKVVRTDEYGDIAVGRDDAGGLFVAGHGPA